MGPVVKRIRTLGVLDRSHTGREGLLELVGLVAVLEDKGVELAAAADLELDLLVGVLLHARSCYKTWKSAKYSIFLPIHSLPAPVSQQPPISPLVPRSFLQFQQFLVSGVNVQEASLRRQISMKLLMSEISRGMLAVLSD